MSEFFVNQLLYFNVCTTKKKKKDRSLWYIIKSKSEVINLLEALKKNILKKY